MGAGPRPPCKPLTGPGLWGRSGAHQPTSRPLSLAEEPTFRCDVCDELFQSKLDLRRHKKYACGAVGAALYEGLGEELKPEGLGSGDGQALECKDCERMFPSKYRCCPTPALQAAGRASAPGTQREPERASGQPLCLTAQGPLQCGAAQGQVPRPLL